VLSPKDVDLMRGFSENVDFTDENEKIDKICLQMKEKK